MSNPITYTELHTTDPERAKEFYRRLFDWKVKDLSLPNGATYTEIDTGAGPLGLRLTETPGVSAQWVAYMQVDNTQAATEKAKSLGARPLRENIQIEAGRFSVLADPTGAVFGLFEPTPKK